MHGVGGMGTPRRRHAALRHAHATLCHAMHDGAMTGMPCTRRLQETVMNVTSIFLANDASPAKRKPLVAVAKEALAAYFSLVRWGAGGSCGWGGGGGAGVATTAGCAAG
jgi:hypothetical protein